MSKDLNFNKEEQLLKVLGKVSTDKQQDFYEINVDMGAVKDYVFRATVFVLDGVKPEFQIYGGIRKKATGEIIQNGVMFVSKTIKEMKLILYTLFDVRFELSDRQNVLFRGVMTKEQVRAFDVLLMANPNYIGRCIDCQDYIFRSDYFFKGEQTERFSEFWCLDCGKAVGLEVVR